MSISPFGFGFDLMSTLFPIFFFVVFAIIIGIFIRNAVVGARQYSRNNASPVLTVDATLVSKRTDVHHHQHMNAGDATGAHGMHTTSSTDYYVTFEVESGDRLDFWVSGREYGMLAEGDHGKLTFQGTRYKGFERTR